ncbi:dihydroneopterin aldolase [Pacificibacter marinus]|uniref:Bifunctional dihydroneopterin aldolase/dihydroneopterin triphosphate 2'-epimerase n=1 Tax=Pacificibacter marinus TaxID=658057 RepID=A0A1Y5SQ94_9RHOB|nr:dihydroneopterin aldolase [Pacificibacter marinus]SEK69142.1 dihydroneopterin aldolase [Pacificibacter marinus]SLN45673.1 bifunctional dihydroneopterin aldolase/dihydroneopterin triphosphate 2'-epimerase [Pacificibacter marinus]
MSDIHLAFDHPEARAAATQSDSSLDRISLRDHVVEVEIGAFQAERGVLQRVGFNIVVELTPVAGPIDDDVDRILSYDSLTEAIQIELAAERLNLLETLAERIASRILTEPRAFRVFVRVEKLDRGPGALGVEIVRTDGQAEGGATQMEAPLPHPLVVYLGAKALASPRLTQWIDALVDDPRPVILAVGLPEGAWPKANTKLTQRRIDLLAVEQNAWTLAGRDARCVVRASRTELDWAMKHDQLSVWAPSKMVLDAVDGPKGTAVDMAAWLAAQLSAEQLLVMGEDLPQDCNIDMHALDANGPIALI